MTPETRALLLFSYPGGYATESYEIVAGIEARHVFTAVSAGFLARGFFPFDGAPAWLPGWYGPWWAALLWLLLELRSGRRQVTGGG